MNLTEKNRYIYVIVTPFKNEIKFLPEVFKSVVNQTILPSLWILVDDGSTDGSYELVSEWAKKISYIKILKLNRKKRREIGFNYSEVIFNGFEYFKQIWNDSYDYIGILDADIVLPNNYYERLIKKFEEDKNLGIASGIVMCRVGERLIWENEPPEWPCGAARVWKRECFEKTGWKITRAPDTVSTVMAMKLGYKTRNFQDLVIIHLRPTWSGGGFWTGYIDIGKTRYYLGYDFISALLASLKYTIEYPHIGAIPFLFGYFEDFIKYRGRINDKFVINFFKKRFIPKIISWFKKY